MKTLEKRELITSSVYTSKEEDIAIYIGLGLNMLYLFTCLILYFCSTPKSGLILVMGLIGVVLATANLLIGLLCYSERKWKTIILLFWGGVNFILMLFWMFSFGKIYNQVGFDFDSGMEVFYVGSIMACFGLCLIIISTDPKYHMLGLCFVLIGVVGNYHGYIMIDFDDKVTKTSKVEIEIYSNQLGDSIYHVNLLNNQDSILDSKKFLKLQEALEEKEEIESLRAHILSEEFYKSL